MTDYSYVWQWNKRPTQPESWAPGNRRGERCRVLARGRMNSCLVEFEDGTRHITSRNGLRKGQK